MKKLKNVYVLKINNMIMVMNVFHVNCPISGMKTKMPVINVQIISFLTLIKTNVKYVQPNLLSKETETVIHALKELTII